MGWAYGIVDGREVGYSVAAKCDQLKCKAKIDRGLAYACGGMHGHNEHGCGGYFCEKHLFVNNACVAVCKKCLRSRPSRAQEKHG